MSNTHPVLARVQQMQTLNDAAWAQIEALEHLPEQLARLREQVAGLEHYYQTQWQQDIKTMEADTGDLYARHMDALPPGRYSILAEDPIWNTLDEFHQLRMAVLQVLKKK